MKLVCRKHLLLEICGRNTFRDIIMNLLYGVKYFFMDFQIVMEGAKEKLKREKEAKANE
jgi:hypothetical protein